MASLINKNLDYNRPVKLADDVYWVGFFDLASRLHCNPYLIIDGDEAILIDGGSRPDFSTVMMKIMETGVDPKTISTLIYHHYDPDLCGNIPHLEDIIGNPGLRILSQKENNVFIRHYATKSPLACIDAMGRKLALKSGRELLFVPTPYAHSGGSFMTYDQKTGILFTSDLFGSYISGKETWELFIEINEICLGCGDPSIIPAENFKCGKVNDFCPLPSVLKFQRKIMTSNKALRNAMKKVSSLKPAMLAPQHGSVIHRKKDIEYLTALLLKLNDVGIDGVTGEDSNG